jgi:hypothetical protein
LFIGNTENGADLILSSKVLTTHVAVLGSTGSGKSGLILNMTEELRKENIPVILVDIKGDMINFALQKDYFPVQCITPGGTHGESINVLADLSDPDKAPTILSAILSMIGEDPDPLHSRAHAYLSSVMEYMMFPNLYDLVVECQEPYISQIGAMSLDDAFPKKERMALARKLNMLLVSPSFASWQQGEKLDIDKIVNTKGVTIYSVAHLINKDEQNFAISFLANEVLQWIKHQAGSKEVKLILGIDECLGLFPPYPANPPSKEPILKLLKQARAFGVGCILGTQNPVDIDYKALSNCNTWLIGRMTAVKDREKVASAIAAIGQVKESIISAMIASLNPRQFILSASNTLAVFRTRDSKCELRGTLVSEEIIDRYGEAYWTLLDNNEPYIQEYDEPIDLTDKKVSNTIEEFTVKEFNIKEALLELSIMGGIAYVFIKLFELFAKYLKEVL